MTTWVLSLLAVALGVAARQTGLWILVWPAATLAATTLIYLVRAPRVLGKRPDGTIAWWGWLAWLPWLAYSWLAYELSRAVTGESVADEVAPGVWVGRRPRARELPAGIAIVVDLCAELAEAPGVAVGRDYLAIPTLDATAPPAAALAAAVDRVLAAGGPAFIHCAFGHGRSATLAAAVLVRRGDATLDDVESKLRARRPRIGLNPTQRAALAGAVALGASRER